MAERQSTVQKVEFIPTWLIKGVPRKEFGLFISEVAERALPVADNYKIGQMPDVDREYQARILLQLGAAMAVTALVEANLVKPIAADKLEFRGIRNGINTIDISEEMKAILSGICERTIGASDEGENNGDSN